MSTNLLFQNEQKRTDVPLWRLFCFVMFCVWQMGIIYFIGPSLNIDGRTPLPISADNMTLLIVAGYVCSIGVMITFPKSVVWLCRIATGVAFASAIGLFLPIGDTVVLTTLIYIQCFCCCFMIGFESATMVHYMTGNSVTRHLLIAYPIGYIFVAVIQNDFKPISFSTFRILMVVMVALLLVFYVLMSSKNCIQFVKKSDGLVVPKRLLSGFLLLAFLGALLGVIAPAAAAEVDHGVFVAYVSCAMGSLLLYLLSKKTGLHPISFASYLIVLSAIGYVLLVVSEHVSGLGLLACALIGLGMSVCAMLPLFALLVVKQYPSKLIVPGYIGLAMAAVIVQSVLVEAFRDNTVLLNLAYLAVLIILALIYMAMEPYMIFAIKRKFTEQTLSEEPVKVVQEVQDPLLVLTKRETEIVDLIICGHSNKDIAKMLFISEYTVKDHTKNIYRKLDVHSRFELTALVNRMKSE